MNFAKLPVDLVAQTTRRCNFVTVVKLKQTCSAINSIISAKKLDEIDVHKICLTRRDDDELDIEILQSPALSEDDFIIGESASELISEPSPHDIQLTIYEQIEKVMKSIKSIQIIQLGDITIDARLVKLLMKKFKIVSATFYECHYDLSKAEVLTFWKMFSIIEEREGSFRETVANFIDDDMMQQLLPTTVLNTDTMEENQYQPNPNLTDRSLEALVKNRPVTIDTGRFKTNYSVDGILKLINSITIHNNAPIVKWFIGAVELGFFEFNRLTLELNDMQSDFIKIRAIQDNRDDDAWKFIVDYQNASGEAGFISIAIKQLDDNNNAEIELEI